MVLGETSCGSSSGSDDGDGTEPGLTESQMRALFRKCGATGEQWSLDRRAFDKAVASDEQRRLRLAGLDKLEC